MKRGFISVGRELLCRCSAVSGIASMFGCHAIYHLCRAFGCLIVQLMEHRISATILECLELTAECTYSGNIVHGGISRECTARLGSFMAPPDASELHATSNCQNLLRPCRQVSLCRPLASDHSQWAMKCETIWIDISNTDWWSSFRSRDLHDCRVPRGFTGSKPFI